MDSETRAAVALLIYSATLTVAILLAVAHASTSTVGGVAVFGLVATVVWCAGPTLLRLLSAGRH
ncbi:MAG: hypothetical protein JWM93_3661 [Frankiales bacterium]|nr:hypothetical protein [Frankiales bacterium]